MITGIATGSDMLLELNVDMQMGQNMAEEICDDSVWVFKSHDPIPVMGCLRAITDKVLVCVRNPYDTIASHFVFSATTN